MVEWEYPRLNGLQGRKNPRLVSTKARLFNLGEIKCTLNRIQGHFFRGGTLMRKRIINQASQHVGSVDQRWLDLQTLAQVELTSEDPAYPIESALGPGTGPGWRAAQAGPQTIRLLFDEPQHISRLHLVFQEHDHERTQQFVLRWSSDGGQSYREIVRQQYNFSPPGTTSEVEDLTVEIVGLTTLELNITPDISRGPCCASLAQLLLA